MSSDNQNKYLPFKGPDSFQRWERRRFFGRKGEALLLRSLVLGNSLSLLHAPSGAGKTSLVNAGLTPALEYEQSWLAIVARPENNPSLEARISTLLRLFPPPIVERRALDRLFEISSRLALETGESKLCIRREMTTEQARTHFDALAMRVSSAAARQDNRERIVLDEHVWGTIETMRSSVLADIIENVPVGSDLRKSPCSPVVQRFLDQSRGPRLLVKHLACLATWCAENGADLDWPDEFDAAINVDKADELGTRISQMSLAKLREVFDTKGIDDVWHRFVARHLRPDGDLLSFLSGLTADWFDMEMFGQTSGMPVGTPRGIVLILDQFEEMFTRFGVDKPTKDMTADEASRTLQHRLGYFRELQAVHDAVSGGHPDGEQIMPVKILISMRDEHIAELGDIRAFAPDLGNATYRLGFLQAAVAKDVIVQSATRYGFKVAKQVTDDVVATLKRPDDSVEPTLLQIVFGYLWKKNGEEISSSFGSEREAILNTTMYEDAGGIEEILRNHVFDVIDGPKNKPHSIIEQFELLTLLDELIMGGDRRAIVPRDLLLKRPGHSETTREKMLNVGISGGLIRLDQRQSASASGSKPLAEITHERMIAPVTVAIVQLLRSNPRLQYLQNALHSLDERRLRDIRRSHHQALIIPEIEVLNDFADHLDLTPEAIEIGFRSALVRGVSRKVLKSWAKRYGAHPLEIELSRLFEDVKEKIQTRQWLDRVELRRLSQANWGVGLAEEDDRRKFLLESLINECGFEDHDLVRDFVRGGSNG